MLPTQQSRRRALGDSRHRLRARGDDRAYSADADKCRRNTELTEFREQPGTESRSRVYGAQSGLAASRRERRTRADSAYCAARFAQGEAQQHDGESAAVPAGRKFSILSRAKAVSAAQQETAMQIISCLPRAFDLFLRSVRRREREKKYVIPPARMQSERKLTTPFSVKPSTSSTAMPVDAQHSAAETGAVRRTQSSPRRRLTENLSALFPRRTPRILFPPCPKRTADSPRASRPPPQGRRAEPPPQKTRAREGTAFRKFSLCASSSPAAHEKMHLNARMSFTRFSSSMNLSLSDLSLISPFFSLLF